MATQLLNADADLVSIQDLLGYQAHPFFSTKVVFGLYSAFAVVYEWNIS